MWALVCDCNCVGAWMCWRRFSIPIYIKIETMYPKLTMTRHPARPGAARRGRRLRADERRATTERRSRHGDRIRDPDRYCRTESRRQRTSKNRSTATKRCQSNTTDPYGSSLPCPCSRSWTEGRGRLRCRRSPLGRRGMITATVAISATTRAPPTAANGPPSSPGRGPRRGQS